MAIIKSHGVQINSDPRKTLIWKKTLPWELFDMFEKTQIKNCYRKVFHRGQIQIQIFSHLSSKWKSNEIVKSNQS